MIMLEKMSAATTTAESIRLPGNLDCHPDEGILLAAIRVLRASGYGHVRKLRCEVTAG